MGIHLEVGKIEELDLTREDVYGVLLQYPAGDGKVINHESLIASATEHNVYVTVAADLMALAILKAPGELGADAVVGTSQRFGVPMGYGGPHAAYFATREAFKDKSPVESLVYR